MCLYIFKGVGESNIVVSSNISSLLEEFFGREICIDKQISFAITVKLLQIRKFLVFIILFFNDFWEGVNINRDFDF